MVYALANRGAAALASTGGGGQRGVRWDTKSRNLSRAFLHHALAVAEVMIAFEAGCMKTAGISLITPEDILARQSAESRGRSRPFRWRVEVRANGSNEVLGIEPDRVFGLRVGAREERRELFFCLEADRGTMPVVRRNLVQTSFYRKLLAYQATWRQKLLAARLGIPNFRVVTVTSSPDRLRNLVEACKSLGGGGGLFLFTSCTSLKHREFLALKWINGRGEPTTLVVDESRKLGR